MVAIAYDVFTHGYTSDIDGNGLPQVFMFPASAKSEEDRVLYPRKSPFDIEHLLAFIESKAAKKVNLSSSAVAPMKKQDL